ncbi:DUF4236 domain-containing protein [Maridesulfovibrio zosterae]|uniref:DUF4236 domain-containing protein n=1 Tax=Maridesulfovibrio zosterae TaxID=82171 RepID=UPI00041E5630|nr:DUF4236 domain-containing protein [Maridesulfovibrio zosterae]
MSMYLRKSIKVGPVRFNLSKSGVGISAGVKGFRVGIRPDGSNYVHAGRHGLYYRKELGKTNQRQNETNENYVEPQTVAQVPNENTTVFKSENAKDIISDSKDELIAKLNKSESIFRLDYGLAIAMIPICLYLANINKTFGIAAAVASIVIIPIISVFVRKNKTVNLEYSFEEGGEEKYKNIISAFNHLASCSGLWEVHESTSLTDDHEKKRHSGASNIKNRSKISAGEGKPKWLNTNIKTPAVALTKQQLYFMPDGLLFCDNSGYAFISYDKINIIYDYTNYIEEYAPSDTKIVDTTWRYPNKKGGPDKRFKDNYEMYVCEYGEIKIKSSYQINIYMLTSKRSAAQDFVTILNKII